MSRHTVQESAVRDLALDREDRTCRECGQRMHVRCRRSRNIMILEGPLRLSVGQVQCCEELARRVLRTKGTGRLFNA